MMPFLFTSRVAMLGLAAAAAACAVAFVLTGPLPRARQFDSTYATNPTPTPGHEHVNLAAFPKATFAAGCFWGVEAGFRKVPGVMATWVGYTGGHTVRPSYQQVCAHTTGHAEAVEVYFDPAKVSYTHLLDVFWSIHDPTTPNRQGPDIGTNYRSEIFTHSPEQYREAVASRDRLARSGHFQDPIVTLIGKAGPFYPAERYHQCYDEKNGVSCPL